MAETTSIRALTDGIPTLRLRQMADARRFAEEEHRRQTIGRVLLGLAVAAALVFVIVAAI